MHSTHAGADAPLLGGFKWLPWGPPFAICKVGKRKHCIGIQALQGLMTVAKQPGEIAAGDLKLSHICIPLRVSFPSGIVFCSNYNTVAPFYSV